MLCDGLAIRVYPAYAGIGSNPSIILQRKSRKMDGWKNISYICWNFNTKIEKQPYSIYFQSHDINKTFSQNVI